MHGTPIGVNPNRSARPPQPRPCVAGSLTTGDPRCLSSVRQAARMDASGTGTTSNARVFCSGSRRSAQPAQRRQPARSVGMRAHRDGTLSKSYVPENDVRYRR